VVETGCRTLQLSGLISSLRRSHVGSDKAYKGLSALVRVQRWGRENVERVKFTWVETDTHVACVTPLTIHRFLPQDVVRYTVHQPLRMSLLMSVIACAWTLCILTIIF